LVFDFFFLYILTILPVLIKSSYDEKTVFSFDNWMEFDWHHIIKNLHSYTHILAYESRMFPRKSPLLIFVPLPINTNPLIPFLIFCSGYFLPWQTGKATLLPHYIPKAHTSDHPHLVQIHHAVVCRPYVLPHTTHVRRHATSAHAHLIAGTVTVVTAVVTIKNTSSHARARAVSSISVHATANVAGSRDTWALIKFSS